MTLHPIEAGNFKLDGGAMFGVVPKSIWSRTNPADRNNLIDIGSRSLLIEEGDKLILVDTGLGDKQSDKFFSYYHRWGGHSLEKSLNLKGFSADDITDVVFTHLHFDHCGGATKWNKDRTGIDLVFKNALHWTHSNHWKWATEPNAREKASFLKENLEPLQESGQLRFIDQDQFDYLNGNLSFMFVDGHTEKQMLPMVKHKGKTIAYTADLIPTVGHIPLPYVIGFDTRPLLTLQEKAQFLNDALENDYLLLFEHDAHNALCSLKQTEKGARLDQVFTTEEIF